MKTLDDATETDFKARNNAASLNKSNDPEIKLADAFAIKGIIDATTYRGEQDDVWIDGEDGRAFIDGVLSASELRQIADWLDPQPDSSPFTPNGWVLVPTAHALPDLDPGCGVTEFISSEARCCGGMAWDLYAGVLNRVAENVASPSLRTEAAVRAEARREALEEAAKVAENCRVVIREDAEGQLWRRGDSLDVSIAIRALIEKEPGNGDAS